MAIAAGLVMGRQGRAPSAGIARAGAIVRPVRLGDPETSRAVRRVGDAIEVLGGPEIVSGRFIATTSATAYGATWIRLAAAAVTRLDHGLGRRMRGWLLVDLVPVGSAPGVAGHVERAIKDGVDVADDARDLWLRPIGYSGQAVDVRLWVF